MKSSSIRLKIGGGGGFFFFWLDKSVRESENILQCETTSETFKILLYALCAPRRVLLASTLRDQFSQNYYLHAFHGRKLLRYGSCTV